MIDQLTSRLHRELILLDEIKAKVEGTKSELLEAMIADQNLPRPLKVSWGQIQIVTKRVWKFRDGGVTARSQEVAKLKTALAVAQKSLQGAEEAAKVAGKAKIESETVSLRVVRGEQ